MVAGNNWKLNLKDDTIYNIDEKYDVLWGNLTKSVKDSHTQKDNSTVREDFRKQEAATRGEPRGAGCHQSLLRSLLRDPVARGLPCNVGMTGSLADVPGNKCRYFHYAGKCDAETIGSGDPFPRSPPSQIGPPHPHPQATVGGTFFALFKRMLPTGTFDQQVQGGSKENRGSSFHAKTWRR